MNQITKTVILLSFEIMIFLRALDSNFNIHFIHLIL